MEQLEPLKHLKSEISDLKSLAMSIARQIGGWTASLQDSDIKGSRYLTEQTRKGYKQQKRSISGQIKAGL